MAFWIFLTIAMLPFAWIILHGVLRNQFGVEIPEIPSAAIPLISGTSALAWFAYSKK